MRCERDGYALVRGCCPICGGKQLRRCQVESQAESLAATPNNAVDSIKLYWSPGGQ